MSSLAYGLYDAILPAAGLAATAVVLRLGFVRRTALLNAPYRQVGLGGWDLFLGLAPLWASMLWFLVIEVTNEPLSDPIATDILEKDKGLSNFTPTQLMQWAIASQVMIHLPMVLYLLWRVGMLPDGIKALGLWPLPSWRDGEFALYGVLLAVPMTMGLSVVVTGIGERYFNEIPPQVGHDILKALQESESWFTTLGLLLSAVVIAPLLEELIFRGLVQSALLAILGSARRWLIILIAAVVFVLIHSGLPWQVRPSLFLLGVVLGWAYERTGRLWTSILIHAGFNGVNAALAFL